MMNWKSLAAIGALLLLIVAPHFGHGRDPEAIWAEDIDSRNQPKLTVRLSLENETSTDWLHPFAESLRSHQVVEVMLSGDEDAAPYTVELGLRTEKDRSEKEQLRVRVLSRDRQVLLAFRTSFENGRESAFTDSSERLAKWLAGRQWSSSVASYEEGRITIHGGTRHQLEPGLELQAIAHQPIFDSDGHHLGDASTPIGLLRLVKVDERMATAEIMSGCEQLEAGTEVILAQTAP